MKKFLLEKGPFVRSVDEGKISTTRMMNDVVIALIPIVLFGFIINGLLPFVKGVDNNFYHMIEPLFNVLIACFASFAFEGLYFWLFGGVKGFKNVVKKAYYNYAIIPGLILCLALPAHVPFYVIIYGCFMANIVFKMLFGGLGHNVFNPALIGYAICVASFGSVIIAAQSAQVEVMKGLFDITASQTPLDHLSNVVSSLKSFNVSYENVVKVYGSLLDLFVGFKPGGLGEVSGLLCVVGFIYLVVRKVINWRVPVIYVGTVFIITWIIAMVNHVEGPCLGIWFPTYNILTGGLLFGAVFMATEPVTTPKSPNGKVLFAILLGVCTVLFRLVGSLPEGVGTSILLLCLFTPVIDMFAASNRGPVITSKMVLRYVAFFALVILLVIYTIFKCSPSAFKEASIMLGGLC